MQVKQIYRFITKYTESFKLFQPFEDGENISPNNHSRQVQKLQLVIDYTILQNKQDSLLLNECNHVKVYLSKCGKSLSKEIKETKNQAVSKV